MYGTGRQGCDTDCSSPTNLPRRWNEEDKNKSLTISEDGRRLVFHEPWKPGDKEAAAARADFPVPSTLGNYYFEVTIIDKGRKGHISVGFMGPNVPLTRLPGWEKDSWGYHGDDGNVFASGRDGIPFGPQFTTGDVIGCGIDITLGKIFYTKNGDKLGYAFDNIGKVEELYPAVGLRTEGESISVNFGQDPFKYNVETHLQIVEAGNAGKVPQTDI